MRQGGFGLERVKLWQRRVWTGRWGLWEGEQLRGTRVWSDQPGRAVV
jgi:hypothetical protein